MSDETRRETFTADRGAAGARLDVWLADRSSDLTRSAVQRLIREGHVRLNGEIETKPGTNLHRGDAIEVSVPAPKSAKPRAEPIALDILFEDDALIVLNKPAGMVVHPAAGNREGTLVNALLHHCGGLAAVGGVERPGIVHRLDKLTSGLMVVAKNDAAHNDLTRQLADRTMKRTYLAVVWGQLQPPEGTIDAAVGRHPRDRKRMAVRPEGGRHAVTHYRTLAATGQLSVIELSLETGRTHQIRVHLAHRGHPVVGDVQYGCTGKKHRNRLVNLPPQLRAPVEGAERQLLHARRLEFAHPETGAPLTFEADLPDDVARVITAIRSWLDVNR
jgi:23S rRNA pseudouridine1911/1915/1917 synthase